MIKTDKINPREVCNTKGMGDIYWLSPPFTNAWTSLRDNNFQMLTLKEFADLEMSKNVNNYSLEEDIGYIKDKHTYVKEAIVYTPKHKLFVRDSPLLSEENIGRVINKSGLLDDFYLEDFCLNDVDYIKIAKKDKNKNPEDRRVLISKNKKDTFNIPTNRFGEDEITRWAFEDRAKEYGLFLKDHGIGNFNVMFLGNEKKSYASQLSIRDSFYNKDSYICSALTSHTWSLCGILAKKKETLN